MDPGDQLSDLCCPICFSCFSEKENIPHMLKCGHTHCHQCLSSLIRRDGGKCGECRTKISSSTVSALPVNYSILRLIEAMKSKDMKHNEFQAVEEKIDNIIKKLNQTQELYKERVRDLYIKIDELEAEKSQMKDTKQSLKRRSIDLGKSKSLDESLAIIKNTVDKIKEVDQQTSFITERLEKGYNLSCIQSLYDTPEEFFINYRGGFGSKCFSLNKKIYMTAFRQEAPEPGKYVLSYHDLYPFMVGAFFIIDYHQSSSVLEFELFKDSSRAKQFMTTCVGLNEFSYRGYSFCRHERVQREGESVEVSCSNSDDPKAVLKILNKGLRKWDYIRKGYLEGLGPKMSQGTHFRIYFEDWPCKKSQYCFAKLTKGGSILRSALRNRFYVTVKDCGLIFDPSLNAH